MPSDFGDFMVKYAAALSTLIAALGGILAPHRLLPPCFLPDGVLPNCLLPPGLLPGYFFTPDLNRLRSWQN
ncbi:hypothetical protein L873DRAFT_1805503 [Choiromyces venosus 120613-1]|uniref:Uncharacterized protein n=1 Tax=Choiromyces venosus 120613-1 TaxID=1336337 RepID=A0A3N4JPV3_9PEZI|nr:hypothetical protein L873DRAFT_1805503 [Choiromyces venosus 120613-1]